MLGVLRIWMVCDPPRFCFQASYSTWSISQSFIEILGTEVIEVVYSLVPTQGVELQKNPYILGILQETLCEKWTPIADL